MTKAIDYLAAIPPTEYGGANAITGFAYQYSWTVCKLIELHKTADDYVVICDYHDDVVVLEGGISSEKVDFYQVKTTQKQPWTLNRLVRQKKGKNGKLLPSVIGKLFRHRENFKENVGNMAIVCNLPFSLSRKKGAGGNDECFTFDALEDNDQQLIIDNIKKEFLLPALFDINISLVFVVSNLNLSDHENGTRGRLEEFLRQRYPSREQFPVYPIFQVLIDEIKRLSGYRQPCQEITELVSRKGFQRKQFEEYIVNCIQRADRRDPQRIVDEVKEQLRHEGMSFVKLNQVTKNLAAYCLERIDQERRELANIGIAAKQYANNDFADQSFSAIIEGGAGKLRNLSEAKSFTDEYLMAIIAWEFFANDGELPTATAQFAEKEL